MAAVLNLFMLRGGILLCFLHLCSCSLDTHEANGVQPELKIFHHSCALKMDEGPCKAMKDRFYFDVDTRRCERFDYGGCQGNANNFETLEECEEMCMVKPDKNPCHLDEEPGPCRGLVPRYFFSHTKGFCERFFYGGCFGNANNFRTKEDCQAKCHQKQPHSMTPTVNTSIPEPRKAPADSVVLAPPEVTNTSGPTKHSTQPLLSAGKQRAAHRPELCFSPIDKGTCSDSLRRYIYNPKRNKCQIFRYSGCGGNNNNFTSKRQCMKTCMKDEVGRTRIRVKKRNFNILFRSV
ncbi:hypothetical protein AGOR_G00062280 [Albula goreensis]|uniref:Tissue factor pathway inhibitor n=1 Tax=Albula goreensis TaxID=1534307 RepID=A0A8T3DYW0_9TELE|nr:hypothetical protein AGOR_G00062280 [Albula goreensis]